MQEPWWWEHCDALSLLPHLQLHLQRVVHLVHLIHLLQQPTGGEEPGPGTDGGALWAGAQLLPVWAGMKAKLPVFVHGEAVAWSGAGSRHLPVALLLQETQVGHQHRDVHEAPVESRGQHSLSKHTEPTCPTGAGVTCCGTWRRSTPCGGWSLWGSPCWTSAAGRSCGGSSERSSACHGPASPWTSCAALSAGAAGTSR